MLYHTKSQAKSLFLQYIHKGNCMALKDERILLVFWSSHQKEILPLYLLLKIYMQFLDA